MAFMRILPPMGCPPARRMTLGKSIGDQGGAAAGTKGENLPWIRKTLFEDKINLCLPGQNTVRTSCLNRFGWWGKKVLVQCP